MATLRKTIMAIIQWLFLVVLALAIVLVIAGQAGLLRGNAPADIGVQQGKLKRPSKTENSACSQADLWPDHPMRDYARVEPFKYSGDGKAALQKIATILQGMERTTLVKQEPTYLYAQAGTALLKFTDDVEFYLDEAAGVIHVRSASRLGRKDFNVNRQRVEAIRAKFNAG
jgi:uncharacterized protein (DUF1499 family)